MLHMRQRWNLYSAPSCAMFTTKAQLVDETIVIGYCWKSKARLLPHTGSYVVRGAIPRIAGWLL
jgi:hypothetical protein